MKRLEDPFHQQPCVKRALVSRGNPETASADRALEVKVGVIKRRVLKLIDTQLSLLISNVKQIGPEVEGLLLSHLQRVLGVHVAFARGWRSAQRTPPAEGDFATVLIDRMGPEVVDRNSGFNANRSSQGQVLKKSVGEGVAQEGVKDMAAIGVQESDGKLIAEQAQFSWGEVKERANARIGDQR